MARLAYSGLIAALLATALVPPVAAHEAGQYRCTVDVGAPFVHHDADGEASRGPTVGGCVLAADLDLGHRVVGFGAGDSFLTPFLVDCFFQVDDDGNGLGFERVEDGDTVPSGATVWATCDAGADLENRIHLHPI